MADLEDARRIATRLPGVTQSPDGYAFSVPVKGKLKGFAWVWNERVNPKKPRVSNPNVLVVIVRNLTEKDVLIGSDPAKFFTEPHYNGYPAVHVRLEAIETDELEDLLIEGWRCKAPPQLNKEADLSR